MSVKAVWMWGKSVRERGAERVVSQCARAGVTDIFFLVKGLLGTAAYPGRFAPCDENNDLLGALLAAAHEKNIRVHAWFTSACDENYVRRHPESGRYHYRKGHDDKLVSLADEGYLHYMEQIVEEVCRCYPIDGLHLDYIRYNHITYGWSAEDRKRWADEGADPEKLTDMLERMYYREENPVPDCLFDAFRAGDADVLAMARARRKDVTKFARRMIGAAEAAGKKLLLTAALMPEGAYRDTAFADLHYGQNYSDTVGLYDYVLPMAYASSYEKNGAWVRDVAEGTIGRGLSVVMGLQAFAPGNGQTLRDETLALDGLPVSGICLFREGSYVMASVCDRIVHLYNPMDEEITRIIARRGDETAVAEETILPDGEKSITFPFIPETLQVCKGDREVCVHLNFD